MSDDQPQSGHILEQILAFTHLLRAMGVDVSPGQALELVRALDYVPITSREDFRGAARCTLILRHEDLPLFDTAFAFFWRAPCARAACRWSCPGAGCAPASARWWCSAISAARWIATAASCSSSSTRS